jgi:hypothetical protein
VIRCDFDGCRVVTSYVKVDSGRVDGLGEKIMTVEPVTFGDSPDWAAFKIGDRLFCSRHHDAVATALAARLGLAASFKLALESAEFAEEFANENGTKITAMVKYTASGDGDLIVHRHRGTHVGWTIARSDGRGLQADDEARIALIAHEAALPARGVHVLSITDQAEWRAHEARQRT